MKQALLYSITPEHVLNFLNGRKTDEIRKRDLPQWAKDKLVRGEIVEGYGYCTMGKPYLFTTYGNDFEVSYNKKVCEYDDYLGASCFNVDEVTVLNGLVVFKFEVSGTTKYVDCSDCTNTENGYECENDFMYLLSVDPILRKSTCLEADEIEEYGNGADLYAHHFTNIQPIEPMELGEFKNVDISEYQDSEGNPSFDDYFEVKRAPQSFMTAWEKGE